MSTKTRFAVRFLTDDDVPLHSCGGFYYHPHGEPGSWTDVIYEAYTARGEKPLYVGQTGNFAKRWRIHARTSPWWPEARFVLLTFAPCLDLTRRYEYLQIRSLRPVHNRQGNPDWMAAQPPQKRRPRRALATTHGRTA